MRIHQFLESTLTQLVKLRADRLPSPERESRAEALRKAIAEQRTELLDFAERHVGGMPTSEYHCLPRAAAAVVGSALLNLCTEVCEGCRLHAIAEVRTLLAAGPVASRSNEAGADELTPVTWERNGDEVRVGRPGSIVALAGQVARLFSCVADQSPQAVAWRAILMSWAKEDLRPRTNEQSLERLGRRVRESLGELGVHWHQDREGARWVSSP